MRPFSSSRLLRLALTVVLAAPAIAQSSTRGGTPLPIGDGSTSPGNLSTIEPTVRQLMQPRDPRNPFGPGSGLGLTRDQSVAMVNTTRDNIKKAVKVAKLRMSEECAKWLQAQCDKGNIKIGWGMTALGTCRADGTTTKKESETVTINADFVVGRALTCHEPAFYVVVGTLRHETQHACQSFEATLLLTGDPKLGKKVACNEIDAHGDDVKFSCDLIDALCKAEHLDPTRPLPAGMDAAVRAMLQSIRSLGTAGERADAAKKLKDCAKALKGSDKQAVECYGVAKKAFCDHIAGTITKAQLKAALNQAKWKGFTSSLDNVLFLAAAAINGKIDQFSGATATGAVATLDTGMAAVMDFIVVATSNDQVLLVTGQTDDGLGEMHLYRDINGDELFDEKSRTVLFSGSTQLSTNMGLTFDGSNGAILAYDSRSQSLFRLEDSNGDEIPDTIGEPINAPSELFDDYLQFEADPTNPVPTLIGYQQVDSTDPADPHDALVLVVQDRDSDGSYEVVFETAWRDYAADQPTFVTVPHGASVIDVYGHPAADVQVWTVDRDDQPVQLLGSGLGRGAVLAATIELDRPLVAGEYLAVFDVTNASRSTRYPTEGAFSTYGQSCGSFAETTLAATPACFNNIGTTAEYALDGAAPRAPGLVIFGTQIWNLDLTVFGAPGCSLLTDLLFTIPIATDAAGHASFKFAIPNSGNLIGAAASTQFAIVAPVNALGLAFSNAVRTTFGGDVRR